VDAIEAAWTERERLKNKIVAVVFHRKGRPIRGFRKAWISACKAAKVSGRIPHDLRRTAVRNLVCAGVPERTVMMVTGHKTRSVVDRYDIVSEADLADAARRLNALTGTIAGTVGSAKVGTDLRTDELVEKYGAEGQNRTADTVIFSHVLYQLSYLGTVGTRLSRTDRKA